MKAPSAPQNLKLEKSNGTLTASWKTGITIKQLCEKLGIDLEDKDTISSIYINGTEKTIQEAPIQNFRVESITVYLENLPGASIDIYL